jgi:hypothetical protein
MAITKDASRQEAVTAIVPFTFADFTSGTLAEAIDVPVGAIVLGGHLAIDTAFDSATSDRFAVGDSASNTRYSAGAVDTVETMPTTGTADGGNTGDGTMTAVTPGADTKAGTYTATCTAVGAAGAITTPATGTADGGNTGANTMGTVSAGASAMAGTYTMTCIDATAAGAEIFEVMAPDGTVLPPATVAAAYTNAQINFTIADPGTDAIVGDIFTVLASAADGNSGTFAVLAPDGVALPDATVAVAYATDQINFTINDGATDFAVGDIFTVLATEAGIDGQATGLTKLVPTGYEYTGAATAIGVKWTGVGTAPTAGAGRLIATYMIDGRATSSYK